MMDNIRIALMSGSSHTDKLSPMALSHDVTITGWFNQPQQFIDTMSSMSFDIIIMDYEVADASTLQTIHRINQKLPYIKIIVVCKQVDHHHAFLLFNHGVVGILSRGDLPHNFAHFARSVYDGRIVISPTFFHTLIGSA